MRLLSLLGRQSPGLLLMALVAGIAAGLSNAGLLALVNQALRGERSIGPLSLLGALLVLCVLVAGSRILSTYLLVRLGQQAVHDLRLLLASRVLAAPLRRLEELGAPRLLVMLTDDLNSVTDSLVNIPNLVINAFVVMGCLAYLAWLSLPMFALTVVLLAFGGLSYYLPMSRSVRWLRQARDGEDLLYRHFQGLTTGTKELKLHAPRRQSFRDSLAAASRTMVRLNIAAETLFGAAASWGQLLVFAVLIGLLFSGLPFVVAGQELLTAYVLILLYMMNPVQAVINSIPSLSRANVAVAKVDELGLAPEGVPTGGTPGSVVPPPSPRAGLALRGVAFAYPAADGEAGFSVGPIDLELRAGELLFVVGGNGSGKTTLLKLLVGLYPPSRGELYIDGEPLPSGELETWRRRFSVVFSDYFLFDALFGLERPSLDQEAGDFLRRLELERKVEVLRGRLSTLDLSQGQRRRLALLTAFLEDRDVYVFDEWAADQDPHYKEIFYRQILPELKRRGKAVVVITHDDRFFALADRLVKMEQGRLRELSIPAATVGGEPR